MRKKLQITLGVLLLLSLGHMPPGHAVPFPCNQTALSLNSVQISPKQVIASISNTAFVSTRGALIVDATYEGVRKDIGFALELAAYESVIAVVTFPDPTPVHGVYLCDPDAVVDSPDPVTLQILRDDEGGTGNSGASGAETECNPCDDVDEDGVPDGCDDGKPTEELECPAP